MTSILGGAILGSLLLGDSAEETNLEVHAESLIEIVQSVHVSPIYVSATTDIEIEQSFPTKFVSASTDIEISQDASGYIPSLYSGSPMATSILGRAILGEAILGSAAEADALDVIASTVITIVQSVHVSPIYVTAETEIDVVTAATGRNLPIAVATTDIEIIQTLRTSPILEDATTTIDVQQSATGLAPKRAEATTVLNVQTTATAKAPIHLEAGTSLLETLNPATGEVTGLTGWTTYSYGIKNVEASSVIDIVQRTRVPKEAEATTTISLSVNAYDNLAQAKTVLIIDTTATAYIGGASATTEIEWEHTAFAGLNANREIDTEINIVQTATVQKLNGRLTCDYRGVNPPSLSGTTLTLSWPFNTPSQTVVLNNPEFGDTHTLNSVRINRTTRGGQRVIYADPIWPKWRTLSLEVTALKSAQVDSVITFLKASIGQEIRLLDWKNREYRGVILNPETAISQVHRNYYRLELQFEGELV